MEQHYFVPADGIGGRLVSRMGSFQIDYWDEDKQRRWRWNFRKVRGVLRKRAKDGRSVYGMIVEA